MSSASPRVRKWSERSRENVPSGSARPLLLERSQVTQYLIALLPIWWVLGVDVVVYPAAAVVVFLISRCRIRWTDPLWCAMPVYAAYATMRLAFPMGQHHNWDIGRLVGAGYNLSLALSAHLCFYSAYRYAKDDLFDKDILRPLARLGVFLMVLYPVLFVVSFAFPSCLIAHPTLLGTIVDRDLPGILENATTATYTRGEWGSGMLVGRVLAFTPFPTCAALVLVVAYCCWEMRARKRGPMMMAVAELGVIVALITTWSRATLAAFVAGTAIKYFASLGISGLARVALLGLAGIVAAGAVAMSDMPVKRFYTALDEAADYKSSSTATRMESYRLAVDMTCSVSPAFGLGFKPSDDAMLRIPVGSHSSFVSTFIKFGFVGLLLVVAYFYIVPAIAWMSFMMKAGFRSDPATWSLFRLQLTAWGWMVFDDFDAFAFPCFLLAIMTLMTHRHFSKWASLTGRTSHVR